MKKYLFVVLLVISGYALKAQFEQPQLRGDDFEKVNVKLGGDFALQYQILDHHADSALIPLGTGFNLPTANMTVDVDLAKGSTLLIFTWSFFKIFLEFYVSFNDIVCEFNF